MPAVVGLHGSGVSAATCAHLLANDGFVLTGMAAGAGGPSHAPVVMLSEAALGLLRDVFGRPGLFADLPRIERRVVAWGGKPVTLQHAGAVVTGAALAEALAPPSILPRQGEVAPKATEGEGSDVLVGKGAAETGSPSSPSVMLRMPPPPGGGGLKHEDHEPFFTIHAAPPFPEPALRHFGSRPAEAAPATLASAADRCASHVEAVASGWLFLIPNGETAWLLGVGEPLDKLLGESRLVAAQIASVDPVAARFETAPRMLEQLCGPDWLACGTSAIAFDPICGDGTAQAVREAVLASAVIAGLRDGDDPAALLGHYQSMLLAAMRRHLQISIGFYRSGGISRWWREQADALLEGYNWCTARLAVMPEPRFLLHGTRLVARGEAA